MSDTITVVIADDHPLMRRGIMGFLVAAGVQIVAEVGDGKDALAAILQHRPTVAILDVEMPRLSGLEVARAVRDEAIRSAVVLLTMYKDEDMFNAAMDAGAIGYVLKENAVDELLACVRAAAKGEPFISPALSRLLLQRAASADRLRQEKPGLDSLTPAERKILKMISEDKTSKEIADVLGISPRTVENHRANVSEKLNLRGSHSLLKFAYDNKARL